MNPRPHTFHRRVSFTASILATLLTLLLLPLSAFAKDRVPLKIGAMFTFCNECDFAEAFEDVPVSDHDAPYVGSRYGVDEGTATHFGAFTTIYRVDFFRDGSVISHFILTAADGSRMEGINRIAPPRGGVSGFVAMFGGDHGQGSGRFAGVSASVEGVIVFNSPGSAEYFAEGTIDNLGRAKKR